MGCCFSNNDDKSSQHGDNERTRLLNPVSNIPTRLSHHDEYGRRQSLPTQRGDEQTALNRILHQTAASVIDVSTLDSHNLEQHEYMDRTKLYSQRINNSNFKITPLSRPPGLLNDVPTVERVLTVEAVTVTDLQLIENLAEKVTSAVREVAVEHKEDLVVHFGIP
ncbi:hypothetical protein CHUAL_011874 [Chamberlinius hualienensis]